MGCWHIGILKFPASKFDLDQRAYANEFPDFVHLFIVIKVRVSRGLYPCLTDGNLGRARAPKPEECDEEKH